MFTSSSADARSLFRRVWLPPCLAVAVSAWLFLFGLGSYPLVDGDAAFYGRLARNAAEQGQWLSPHFTSDPLGYQMDKPPLPIWAMALSFAVGGPGELEARGWHAVLAVVLVALIVLFAKSRLDARGGMIAGLVLATSGAVFYLSREPLYDIPLTLFVSATIVFADAYASDRRVSRFMLACAALGLGVLTKGPVAIVLPVATLMLAAWWSGRPMRRYLPPAWSQVTAGLFLAALVAVPWHVMVLWREGPAYAERFLGATSWNRYLIPDRIPGVAIPMYAGLVVLACLPWSGIVAASTVSAGRTRDTIDTPRLALAWMLVPVVFFGLSPGPVFLRYILPSLPGAALLVAWWLAQPSPPFRRTAAALQAFSGIALVGASAFVGRFVPSVASSLACQAVAAGGAVTLASGAVLWTGHARRAFVVTAVAACLMYSWLLIRGPAVAGKLWPEREAAAIVNATAGRSACVTTYRAPSAPFLMLAFYLHAPLSPSASAQDLRAFLDRVCDRWIIESPGDPLPRDIQTMLELVSRHPAGIGVWRATGTTRIP